VLHTQPLARMAGGLPVLIARYDGRSVVGFDRRVLSHCLHCAIGSSIRYSLYVQVRGVRYEVVPDMRHAQLKLPHSPCVPYILYGNAADSGLKFSGTLDDRPN
jgi:hypothetical protein